MRRLRYLVISVALLGSGVYLFVYLYRWEWHRALVAGVFFVAAEVALAAAAILDRLRSIEARLGSPGPGAGRRSAETDVLLRIEETASEPRVGFEWLSPQQDGRLSVFVPLLLGAGVVLSGAAWIVERAARVTARPALERGLADRLSVFTLPAGTLSGTITPAPGNRTRSMFPHLVVVVVAALLIATVGLDALGDATQNRPDPLRPGTASSVVMVVASRPERPALAAAEALWGACTTQLGRRHRVLSMTEIGGRQVQVVVRPEVAKYAERRLRGCIADATMDQIQARVRQITPLGASS